jgi:hypothetical protein
VDRAPRVLAPFGQEAREPLQVAVGGLESLERLAQVGGVRLGVRPGRVVRERLAAGVGQDLQVGARVSVELREDLVGIHVGPRLGKADAAALGQLARRQRAWVELHEHVLEARLRAQEHLGVAVDRLVLVLDLQLDDRDAVLELDAADVADLDAGDVHGLALAGHDCLAGLELGLDLVEVRADAGHPGGQVEALVGQDVAGDARRHDDQEDDRDEVAQVLSDRARHGPGVPLTAFSLTLGIALVWHSTSRRYGGLRAG